MAALNTLKRLLYPVTLLTLVALLSIGLSILAIYKGLTLESPAIIYPIVVVPITLFILCLYVVDRFLVHQMNYFLLMLAELLLLGGGYLLYSYSSSSADIHIATDEDYIFVLYDTDENSLDNFSKKGLFGKEWLVSGNIVHLNPSLISRNDIRILPPDTWMSIHEEGGKYFYKGDSIPYIYKLRNRQANEYERTQQVYIDSLLALALLR
ncbi:hypothetical protein [Mangrovimonas sp. YM274]|uniref:hypothetical protein n=1 Tax=Mangrovimonas sp. YM274 TaxID=3070660 RepID=UPI0027DB46F1|nr:hypothetical protein [Mangrovimonas sp. YM274]WMI69171.1 hypothetical protein RBH95_02080 [Mangrovimonas sp. YM274]